MSKPVQVDAKLAERCKICGQSILLLAYPNIDHTGECQLNIFTKENIKLGLKQVEIDSDVTALVSSEHNLPIRELKFPMRGSMGYAHAVYAPEWLSEGVNMYRSSQFAGLSLVEFLTAINPDNES